MMSKRIIAMGAALVTILLVSLSSCSAEYNVSVDADDQAKTENSQTVDMPNLVGMNVYDAYKKYSDIIDFSVAGYRFSGESVNTYPVDTIFQQSIFSGKKISKGITVQVYVSDGNAVKMPDVVGKSEKDAADAIKAAGLNYAGVHYRYYEPYVREKANGKNEIIHEDTVYTVIYAGVDYENTEESEIDDYYISAGEGVCSLDSFEIIVLTGDYDKVKDQ